MYWASNNSAVKMASLNGTNKVTLLNESKADYTGITLYNNSLYISDSSRRSVFYTVSCFFFVNLRLASISRNTAYHLRTSTQLITTICVVMLREQIRIFGRIRALTWTMWLVYRNIIKFDLASRVMSLQAPAQFSSAHDVKYFTSEGKMLLF